MGKKQASAVICDGSIDTDKIYQTHREIKRIVEAYKVVDKKVADITSEVNENWIGKGNNEFRTQYKLLIKKIEDFGDILEELYQGLIEAEATYEATDDDVRQDFAMSTDKIGQGSV